ncbi:MAG: hypothetical protein IPO67_09640 [Deltaproteobacteria bacterium]|nr:hypothetical protein [Deltaproteobacteria bacterium]
MRSFILSLLLVLSPAMAGDATQPHPHQGVLKPYPQPPKAVPLTAAQEATLATGQPVFVRTDGGDQGRGAAVFIVNAPREKVWKVIKSFSSYPYWVDGVKKCEVYKTSGNNVYVRFVIGKMGVEMEYFIKHMVSADGEWITWTLDYSRLSDLDDSGGCLACGPPGERPHQEPRRVQRRSQGLLICA